MQVWLRHSDSDLIECLVDKWRIESTGFTVFERMRGPYLQIEWFLPYVGALHYGIYYYAAPPVGWGTMYTDCRRLSVRHGSVSCLTLSGKRKGLGSWTLAEGSQGYGRPVTPFRGWKVKGQGHQDD